MTKKKNKPCGQRNCFERIVSRHRFGEGYKQISAPLKIPKRSAVSRILKWKRFGTTRTLGEEGP